MATSASRPCPTFSGLTASEKRSTKASWIPDCTRIRLAQTHVWPALRNFESMAPWTAASMSASSKTMNGAFPPSSRAIRFTVPAHWAINNLPTSVDPVNVSILTARHW